jgi:hypothetical protein
MRAIPPDIISSRLLSDDELWALEGLMAKAPGRPARNPEAPCRKEATLLIAK